MRKYLGWISLGIIGVTLLLFSLGIGKISGFAGTNILLIGAILALITVLLSKRGKLKNLSLLILSVLIGGFAIIVIGFILNGGI